MPGASGRDMKDLVFLFLIVFAIAVVLAIGGVAQIVIIASLLAYILDPLVRAFEVRGMSRTMATLTLFIIFIAVVGLLGWILVPVAIEQIRSLQSGTASQQTTIAIDKLEELLRSKLSFVGLGDLNLAYEIQRFKTYLGRKIVDFLLKDSVSLIIHGVTIPFIMFFLLKDGRDMKKYFISVVPNRYFEFTLDLLYKMDLQLGNYLRGQFIDAAVFGLMTTLTLWILGVPYFVFIGAFAGLANLIPFIGPIAGVLPAAAVATLADGDVVRGGYVVLAFVILKLVDDIIVQPLAVGKTVDLHPMIVAIAILVGGSLFGILGMLLVVPVTGFLKVVLEESIVTFRKYRFS